MKTYKSIFVDLINKLRLDYHKIQLLIKTELTERFKGIKLVLAKK